MYAGIDITSIIYGRGVSRYTSHLVRALALQPNLKLHLFGSSLRQKTQLRDFANNFPSATSQIRSWPPTLLGWWWRHNQGQVASHQYKLDVFHAWDYIQPPDHHLPIVSTIHDLAMLKYPATAHPQILHAHTHAWSNLKQRQAHIITVSEAVRTEVIARLEFPANHVHTIHSAIPTELTQAPVHMTEEVHETIYQKLTVGRPFMLCVGTREPRKNLRRMIEAWTPFAHDFDLLIVGEAGWDDSAEFELVKGVRLMGKISDQELAVLYTEAAMLLFASLDEGFGLPILEAFYFGTPVVTSNRSGMKEVAGIAAELVDPESVESIRTGITNILNETLAEQQLRLQRMIVRQHSFSWQKTAKKTIEVYQKAINTSI